MASSDIRLRLVIRRHGLPEVKVVWPCTASDDLTVARLLSSINEVIPLESTHWGLEDYAVELTDEHGGSFECLHFQQINKILKHDDQVLIRSLQTDDVRRRRISGREQISSDGKHLFDGVAFGRPWLRTPRGRPPLELPPRKRARISYNFDDADRDETIDHGHTDQQLMLPGAVPLEGLKRNSVGLRVAFEDEDIHDADHELDHEDYMEEEDDDDFEPDAEDGSVVSEGDEDDVVLQQPDTDGLDEYSLKQELQLLKHDNAASVTDDDTAALLEPDDSAPALPSIHFGADDQILPLQGAFPLSSVASIRKEYKRQKGDLRRTHQALCLHNDPRLSFDEMMEEALCGPKVTHSTLQQDLHNVRAAKRSRPLIEEVDAEPPKTNSSDASAAVPPTAVVSNNGIGDEAAILTAQRHDNVASDSGSSSEETSSSGANSEVEDSPSSDENDSDEEPLDSTLGPASGSATNPQNMDTSSDDSDDSSSGGTSSDENAAQIPKTKRASNKIAEPAAQTTKAGHKEEKTARGLLESDSESDSDTSSTSSSSDSDSDSDSDSESEPEVHGVAKAAKKGTAAAISATSQTLSISSKNNHNEAPPGQGLTKTQKRNLRRRRAQAAKNAQAKIGDDLAQQTGGQPHGEAEAAEAESLDLQTRKAALLASIGPESPAAVLKNEPLQHTAAADIPQSNGEANEELPRRRMRVDLGAGRRMLFGALGMKNPKTKEDEQKLRDGLLKDVRPLQNHRLMEVDPKPAPVDEKSSGSSSSDSSSDESSEDEEEADAWKQKISYRAVECCQEGVVLSEPPFPFVQRWDPQQQFGARKKRKRKSEAVFDEEYVGDDSMLSNIHEEHYDMNTPASRKKARTEEENNRHATKPQNNGTAILDYDDPIPAAGSKVSEVDDLPELPENVDSLPSLKPGDVRIGMVITWKEWSLSKGKSWTPQLNSVTALVVQIISERELDVLLAQRDRKNDEREFDPETGERIYSKFEMPGVDEEEEAIDDGHRSVSFDDMLEPRLVQDAPSPESLRRMPPVDEHQDEGGTAENVIDPHRSPQTSAANASFQDASLVASQEIGSSASIPSGQPLVEMENNPFSQLFNVSTSAIGSTHAQKDASMLHAPDAQSTPRQGSAANTSFSQSPRIVVVEELDGNGDAITNMNPKRSVSSPSKGIEKSIPSADLRNSMAEEARPTTVDPKVLQPSLSPGNEESSPEPPQDFVEAQDSLIPETLLEQHVTPIPHGSRHDSSKSSSPIPSIEEIFYTAAATRQIRSPSKQPEGSNSNEFHSDPGYLEAMQKLDEEDDSDAIDVDKSSRMLFKSASQPVKLKTEPVAASRKTSSKQKALPFVVPPGSQVIELVDSAPDSPTEVSSVSVGNHTTGSNGSTKTKKVKTKSSEAYQSVKTRGLAFNSSPSANTRQPQNSNASAPKRGRGRPRKSGGRI